MREGKLGAQVPMKYLVPVTRVDADYSARGDTETVEGRGNGFAWQLENQRLIYSFVGDMLALRVG